MTTLREAAQQALEALEWHYRQGHSNTLGGLRLKIDEKALRNLKAALAEHDKNLAWFKERKANWDLQRKLAEETQERDRQQALTEDALQRFTDVNQEIEAALSEPTTEDSSAVEPVAWGCFKDGELQSELVGTKADVDFWVASDEPHMQGMVAGPLYTTPPQRKPLTGEEIEAIWKAHVLRARRVCADAAIKMMRGKK